jgi:hypothetical protein
LEQIGTKLIKPDRFVEKPKDRNKFKEQLTELINRHSQENYSNTPDFLLAQFMCMALVAYEETVKVRDALKREVENRDASI